MGEDVSLANTQAARAGETPWPLAAIRVGRRYRQTVGDLGPLATSLQILGLLHPLVIQPDGTLMAGRRRLEAARQLGWTEIPVRVLNLADVVRAEHDENVLRLDFAPSERVAIARALQPIEQAAARARQEALGRTHGTPSGNFPEGSVGQARDKVAVAVGVSGRTLDKALQGVAAAEANPARFGDLPDLMDTKTVHRAFVEWRRRLRHDAIPGVGAPTGEDDVLYADPPWPYAFTETPARAIENHYPTMTLAQIQALPVPAAADAVCSLWAPPPKLAEAIGVLAAWGFEYRTCAVWVKDRIGMGYWFRQQHELVLVGRRGQFPVPEPDHRVSSVFHAPRGAHSTKPAEMQHAIAAMYPSARRVELFARTPAPGWAVWGNEVTPP
jgi:N6-adenosine-specific RNA methylase IME4